MTQVTIREAVMREYSADENVNARLYCGLLSVSTT